MQNTFFWHELMTSDAKAAIAFYGSVVGWEAKPFEHTTPDGAEYIQLIVPGYQAATAGLMELTGQMKADGIPPAWGGYVYVNDVDAKAEEFQANGGAVHVGPVDIPGVGRFAVVADPHGAFLNIMSVLPMGDMPEQPKVPTPGTVGWNELYAGNLDEAFAFYSRMFGWQKSMGVDMGDMGTYQLFSLDGRDLGGMMTKMPHQPMPYWSYYFCVDGIDAAVERVKAGGGQILMEPHQVPGGSWIVPCQDPQGAYFNLTSQNK